MTDKIMKFLKRNKRRNKHLWDDDKILNIDYVICPVTNTRLSMIKKSYIENVLEMSLFDFDNQFPNCIKCCENRKNNIKNGLKQIDDTTRIN